MEIPKTSRTKSFQDIGDEEEVNLEEFGIESDDVRFILLAERVEILCRSKQMRS